MTEKKLNQLLDTVKQVAAETAYLLRLAATPDDEIKSSDRATMSENAARLDEAIDKLNE
jgi:hypothetical protein